MLNEGMKKIFDNLYIFSKFSSSIILLLLVAFLIYIISINYQNYDKVSNLQLDLENDLRKKINDNYQYIKNISTDIQETKDAIYNLEKTVKDNSSENSEFDLTKINESIAILNKNFKELDLKISSLKSESIQPTQTNNSKSFNQSINEMIELIKIKYENNLDFDKELLFLQTIAAKENNSIFEKISILKNQKYKGHLILEKQFDIEVNLYLKKIINQNENFFNKILLPYINVSPSSENKINDDKILLLEEIKFHIENRNIDKALNILNKFDDYELFFPTTSIQMKNYNNFIKQLMRIK